MIGIFIFVFFDRKTDTMINGACNPGTKSSHAISSELNSTYERPLVLDPEHIKTEFESNFVDDKSHLNVRKQRLKSGRVVKFNHEKKVMSMKNKDIEHSNGALTELKCLCSFCSKPFAHQGDLIVHHERAHTDKLHFACSFCKKKFAIISHLTDHVSTHNVETIFKCCKCSRSFTSPLNLVKHKCKASVNKNGTILTADSQRPSPPCSVVNRHLFTNQIDESTLFSDLASHHRLQSERWATSAHHRLQSEPWATPSDNKVQIKFKDSVFLGNHREDGLLTNSANPELNNERFNTAIQTNNNSVDENVEFKPMLPTEAILREHDISYDNNELHVDYLFFKNDVIKTRNCSVSSANKLVHAGEQQITYNCMQCDVSFLLKRLLNRHNKIVHSGERKRPFKCTQCDKSFFNKQNLEHHKPTHSNERLVCIDCKKEFCGTRALNRHKLIHVPELNYVCSHCQKKFARLSDLSSHVLKQHRQKGPFICPQCDKLFSVTSNLNAHIRRMHNEGGIFLCMHCGNRYTTKASLNNHLVVHGDTMHECTQCNKKFIRLHSLKYHMEQIHCETKPCFLCPLCGKGFTKKSNLNYHILIHTGERRYACTHCDKKFTKPHDVKIHIRRVHGSLRPFVCTQCDKNFATNGQLKVHKKLHCSGQGYACQECNKTFPFVSALNRHVKQEHGSPCLNNMQNFVSC